jgi:hypothetical protein
LESRFVGQEPFQASSEWTLTSLPTEAITVGSTKTKCLNLTLLLALLVVAISPEPWLRFVQNNWGSVSAASSDIRKPGIAVDNEAPKHFDQAFEGTAEDKQRMDEFAAQITVCLTFLRRSIAPFLMLLYIVICIILILRAIVKNMATDSG